MTWHETANRLLTEHHVDPEKVRAALEHAAVGLLHQPAASSTAGQSALYAVNRATAELAHVGVTAPRPAQVDDDTAIRRGDIRPLLAAVVADLAGCAGQPADLLAYARAALFAQRAVDELTDA